MSVIVVGGVRYAAGLYWLGRGGPRATARTARRLARPWYVHADDRTGFAAGGGAESPGVAGEPDPEPAVPDPGGDRLAGVPALALALREAIPDAFWMALVEGAGEDGGERYALVKARDGAVLADGDEAFADRAAALAAFERARALGWSLHATAELAGVLDPAGSEVAALDGAALGEAASRAGAAIALERAVTGRGPDRRVLLGAIGLAVLIAVAAAWLGRDALVAWLAAPVPVPAALGPEPTAGVAVDAEALIGGCRRALMEHPPFLPGWLTEGIACAARFADPELTALRPELAGRPVLLVRWRLRRGHAEAMQRRLAEAHLANWHAAAVADGRAWAAMPLDPVLRIADGPAPAFLALRRAVDLAFGARGAGVGYARGAGGGWTVGIQDRGPLDRLAPLAGGIAGLEVTALARAGAGGWRLEGRLMAPETLTLARLRALGVPVAEREAGGSSARAGNPAYRAVAPETAGNIQPKEETRHGTDDGS